MKKTLFIAGMAAAILMSTSVTYAATTNAADTKVKPKCEKKLPPKHGDFKGKKAPGMERPDRPNLDERLKLTEEQKKQAHDIRMQGHKKMKPVFEKMKAKKEQIREIKKSDLSQEQKAKKIEPLKKDLKKLKQEARKIRMENTKEFEAILTPEQKAEFEKIKQEGREKAKQHKMKKRPCPINAKPAADKK